MNWGGMNLLCIEFFMVDKTLVVVLDGEIDHHTCVEIRERVDREYQKNRAKDLLFDFANVSFMDSSGIGMLMGRYRSVMIGRGSMGVYNVSKEVDRILHISGIYKLMKVYENKEQALQALAVLA